MGVLASCSLFLIPLLMISMIPATTCVYWYHVCDNTTTFAPNSTYQTNLNTVFLSLSSNATNSKNSGFYYTTAGSGTANTVYGSFLCRGDDTPSACRDCVATATKTDLPKTYCPNEKEAVIWYDECMVRYSYNDFYHRMAEDPKIVFQNTGNVDGNKTNFIEVFREIMNKVTSRASIGEGSPPTKKFATGKASVTPLETLYGMVQCTPDLSQNDCNRCLGIATGQIPIMQGARLFQPSCFVRYELYSFYTGDPMVTLSLPPPDSITNTRSPPPPTDHAGENKMAVGVIIAIVSSIAAVLVALLILGFCLLKKKAEKYDAVETGEEISTSESLQYDLGTLQHATNNFSDNNKLGTGGFGSVYKGTLINKKEIAVKKLSRNSSQGIQEFKNEITLLARLQHRNLVKLLGFCFAGEEKLLVYEYVPNKSLDYFLFDAEKKKLLNWGARCKIIEGVARGLLYLHQDSRLRIIHRDLKASNILLDTNMNAKITDFGMAKIFGVDQTQGNTSRIVGTYGYMSPEYAMQGQFSTKSDVYSFGILVLEIISGKRNTSFGESTNSDDLVTYAWKSWKDNQDLQFVDATIRDSCSTQDVRRFLHLGLLSVQEAVDERPTMGTVVLTLSSDTVTLPMPEKPVLLIGSSVKYSRSTNANAISSSDQSSNKSVPWSVNDISITEIDGR